MQRIPTLLQKLNELAQNGEKTDIVELVMKVLYENAHRNALDLEKEIFAPSNIKLPVTETQRIWDILTSSGFISPVVGFGNAGISVNCIPKTVPLCKMNTIK